MPADYLAPAVIGLVTAGTVLFIIYLVLYLDYRRSYLLCIALALGLVFLMLGTEGLDMALGYRPWIWCLNCLFFLGAAGLVLWGMGLFTGRAARPAYFLPALAAAGWCLLAVPADISIIPLAAPAYLTGGAMVTASGILVLRQRDIRGLSRHLAGWSMVLWGLHLAKYPFFRTVGPVSYWGFVISTALAQLAATGGLLIFFQRVRQELDQSRRSLLVLSGGAAHNFNNVLMAVMANIQAAAALLGEGQHRAAGLLKNACAAAAGGREVARRLTSYVGAKAGQADEPALLDLGEVVRQAAGIAEAVWQRPGGPEVTFALDLEPGLTVRGSRGQLSEVLLNLLTNAVEAMPAGGLVSLTGRRQEGRVLLTVEDRGRGMTPEEVRQAGTPFFTTKGVKGAGLGLASSLGIVESHGGKLRMDTRPGRGTRMEVFLPLEPGQAPALSEPGEEEAPRGALVLLVEDEALVAMGLKALMELMGLRVRHARDISEARSALVEALPDLVLCDLGLPDGPGWEVGRELCRLKDSGGAAPPLVVITGWAPGQMESELPGDMEPPAAILHKPVDRASLVRALARALGKGSGPLPVPS